MKQVKLDFEKVYTKPKLQKDLFNKCIICDGYLHSNDIRDENLNIIMIIACKRKHFKIKLYDLYLINYIELYKQENTKIIIQCDFDKDQISKIKFILKRKNKKDLILTGKFNQFIKNYELIINDDFMEIIEKYLLLC
jgi:hypothetical protein